MLVDLVVHAALAAPFQQLPEPTHDPAEVREAADEIMSRPEYQEPPRTLFERILDWIGDLVGDAVSGLSLGGALPPFVAWLVLATLVAGVGFLIVRSVQAGSWRRRSRRRRGKDAPEVITSAEEHRSATEWLAEAERHEREGRWREGLLCRYRSLVTKLVAREVLAEVVGRTAGEYVRDVTSGWPDRAAPFVAATDLFEAAWYGGRETGPDERDRFAELTDRTLAVLTADQAPVAAAEGGR